MSNKTVGTEDEDEDDGTSGEKTIGQKTFGQKTNGEKTFGKVPQTSLQFSSAVMTPGNSHGVQLSRSDISNSSELVVSDTLNFPTTGDMTQPQVTIVNGSRM